jgi:drug/metabolite transporter (DMT)-like permease
VSSKVNGLLCLHSAVLLFAIAGLFGKWLAIPAFVIVIGRAGFAAIALAAILSIKKGNFFQHYTIKQLFAFFASGVLLAVHWTTFFYSIQVSSVAIGLITFATFPLFVSFLEPLLFKQRFRLHTIIQALLIILGVSLVVPMENIDERVMSGIIWGVVSAFTFALLTLYNRKVVSKGSAAQLACFQNGFAAICLLPFLFVVEFEMGSVDWLLLIVLGVIFTALSHTLYNFSLKTVTGQVASIAVSLEPVYGILAAYFFIGEPLTLSIAAGCAIVIATNFWASKQSISAIN